MKNAPILSGPEEFGRALAFALRWEGGYVDHPADPGGATNKGITQKTYNGYRKAEGLPLRGVEQLEDSEMRVIYFENYWEAGRCPFLPWPVCLVHFDACVNHGIVLAIKLLQGAASAATDGRFGPKTRAAIAGKKNVPLALDYVSRRRHFYHDLVRRRPKSSAFLRGWMNRMEALAQVVTKSESEQRSKA